MVGVPVIINHKDLNKKNADEERVGVVNSVWYDNKDGWYWCDGIIWDETAQNLITDKNWSVSCSYDVITADNKGGSENNIKYDIEFLDGVFTHLALVSNPRYERANIVFNSKTEVLNDKWVTIKPNGEEHKGRHLLIKDGENVYDAMRRQWGVDVKGQQHLFDRKKYKTDTNYKEELYKKLQEHLKTVQKRQDNLEYLGVAEPDKLKDEDYEDISFEEWEDKQKDNKKKNDVIKKHFEQEYKHYNGDAEPTKELDEVKESMENIDSGMYSDKDVIKVNKYINEAESADFTEFAQEMRKKYEKLPLETNDEYFKRERENKKFQPKLNKTESYYDDDMEESYTDSYADSISKDFDEFMKSKKEEKTQEPPKSDLDQKREAYEATLKKMNEASKRKWNPKDNADWYAAVKEESEAKKALKNKYLEKGDLELDKVYKLGNIYVKPFVDEDGNLAFYDRTGAWGEGSLSQKFLKSDLKNLERAEQYDKLTDKELKFLSEKGDFKQGEPRGNNREKYKKGNNAKITEKRFEKLFTGGDLENNQYRITKVLSNKAQVTFDKKRGQIIFYKQGDLSDSKDYSAPKGTIGMLEEFRTSDYDKLVDYLVDIGEEYRLKANNSKEQDMALIEELKKLITKVENDKGDDMDDKEKIENEKVDKRDIIRQIMAIAGKHEDNEDVKTIAKLAEKLGYDESEAGSADNKKAKNEKEDEAENCKVKNEDIEDKEKVAELKEDEKKDVENKCRNSKGGFMDKMNEIYNSTKSSEQSVEYVSRDEKIKAANDYFAK